MSYNNATVLREAATADPASLVGSRLTVSLAHSREEVKEAQRLRHRVFVEEMGAHAGRTGNLERDRYDPFCIHLIARDGATGEVVSTYRILTPERAAALGSLMAERESDPHALYERLAQRHLAPAEYRVPPRTEPPRREGAPCAPIPPLLKGYLRAGAWICGEAASDPEFETADLPVLLPLQRVESRYARHFLRGAGAA